MRIGRCLPPGPVPDAVVPARYSASETYRLREIEYAKIRARQEALLQCPACHRTTCLGTCRQR